MIKIEIRQYDTLHELCLNEHMQNKRYIPEKEAFRLYKKYYKVIRGGDLDECEKKFLHHLRQEFAKPIKAEPRRRWTEQSLTLLEVLSDELL